MVKNSLSLLFTPLTMTIVLCVCQEKSIPSPKSTKTIVRAEDTFSKQKKRNMQPIAMHLKWPKLWNDGEHSPIILLKSSKVSDVQFRRNNVASSNARGSAWPRRLARQLAAIGMDESIYDANTESERTYNYRL